MHAWWPVLKKTERFDTESFLFGVSLPEFDKDPTLDVTITLKLSYMRVRAEKTHYIVVHD